MRAFVLLAFSTLPLMAGAAPEPRLIAVLEVPEGAGLTTQESRHLADIVRGAAVRALPRRAYRIMTRENMLGLLPPGVDLAGCVGDCEIETGRNLGAAFVVSGEVLRFGASITVSLKLHETEDGTLLASEQARAGDLGDLVEPLEQAAARLFAALDARDRPSARAAPETGELLVTTRPAGARIYVDGALHPDRSPARLDAVPVGPLRVRLKLPGHADVVATVHVAPNTTTRLHEVLEGVYGRLSVDSDPDDARVSLDGQAVGETPLELDRVVVGEHRVRIEHPSREDHTSTVTVREGELTRVRVALTARRARLSLVGTTPGLECRVSAVDLPRQPEAGRPVEVEIAPGDYEVVCRAPGHEPWEEDFEAEAGQLVVLSAQPEPIASLNARQTDGDDERKGFVVRAGYLRGRWRPSDFELARDTSASEGGVSELGLPDELTLTQADLQVERDTHGVALALGARDAHVEITFELGISFFDHAGGTIGTWNDAPVRIGRVLQIDLGGQLSYAFNIGPLDLYLGLGGGGSRLSATLEGKDTNGDDAEHDVEQWQPFVAPVGGLRLFTLERVALYAQAAWMYTGAVGEGFTAQGGLSWTWAGHDLK